MSDTTDSPIDRPEAVAGAHTDMPGKRAAVRQMTLAPLRKDDE